MAEPLYLPRKDWEADRPLHEANARAAEAWAEVHNADADAHHAHAALESTTSSWTPGTSYSDIGPSVALTSGTWLVVGKATFEYATGSIRSYFLELFNNTASAQLDEDKVFAGTAGGLAAVVQDIITVSAATTLKLRGKVSATDGTQFLTKPSLIAVRIAA